MKTNDPTLPIRVDDDTARLLTVIMHTPPERDPWVFQEELATALKEEEALFRANPERRNKPPFPAELGDPYNIDLRRYCDQHTAFVTLLQEHGVEVLQAAPVKGCIAQAYTRDIAFVMSDIVFVTRPQRTDRRRETQGIDSLLKRCARLVRLKVGSIEGGDVIVLPQWVLVGIGENTEAAAADELRDELAAHGIGRHVVPLHLAMSRVVHLDCVFNPVSPEVALIYPPALTEEAYAWLRRRFDLIEATLGETTALQINTINLTPRAVVMMRGSDRLAERLTRRGFEVVMLAYDEVGKGQGAFRCTTLPLRRE